jgi:hypothetical protein
MAALKTINYRGGIARFRVPSSWVEEYNPAGGGTFYEAGPDTGTLRINVMDFEKPEGGSGSETAQAMLPWLDGAIEVRQRRDGVAVARSSRKAVEEGERLLIRTWQVGVRVTPQHFRILVFTYTILAEQECEPAMQQELDLLDKQIAEGEYPAVRGVPGDYIHKHDTTG